MIVRSVFSALLLTSCTSEDAATPDQASGYFEINGEPTVLVGSSEHYGALVNSDFDPVRYLDEIQKCGLNYVRIFSGTYRETIGSFGIFENTLAPIEHSFIAPWAKSDADSSRYDLTKWNPQWVERLRSFVSEADQRGIVVELTLFCPFYDESMWKVSPMNPANHIHGAGDMDSCFRADSDLLPYQKALARKCAEEIRDFSNVFFEIINEPYQGKVDEVWQRAIIDELVRTESGFPNKHRIAVNVANGNAEIKNPHPAVSVFNFHYAKSDAASRNLKPGRMIGDDETGFAGKGDFVYRREAWEFLLAGGGSFNNLDFSFTRDHEDGTADWRAPGGGGRAIRKQLGFLRKTLQAMPLENCAPRSELVVGDAATDCRVSVFGNPESGWLIYLAGKAPEKLRLDLGNGSWSGSWNDPGEGSPLEFVSFEHSGGVREFKIPFFSEDCVLRLGRGK